MKKSLKNISRCATGNKRKRKRVAKGGSSRKNANKECRRHRQKNTLGCHDTYSRKEKISRKKGKRHKQRGKK